MANTPPPAGARQPSASLPGWLPTAAVIAAVLAGPLGLALGAWWLTRNRDPRTPGRTAAFAAVIIGALWTVGAGVGIGLGIAARSSTPSTDPSAWTYPSTAPANTNFPVDTATPTPGTPTATSLDEFVPAEVSTFTWEGRDDPDTVAAGAQAAETGTFTSDGEVIQAGMAAWDSAGTASAHAQQAASERFASGDLRGEGTIRSGGGHWWYYQRDGEDRATLFWYFGRFSAEFTGTPLEVQEFFLSFPK